MNEFHMVLDRSFSRGYDFYDGQKKKGRGNGFNDKVYSIIIVLDFFALSYVMDSYEFACRVGTDQYREKME